MRTLLVAILALAAAPATVYAQAESAYYGLALGTFDYEENDFFGDPFLHDSASSYRLMVGYQFLDHLGVEGGYGKVKKLRDVTSNPGLDISLEFRMLTLRLLGVLPFDNGVSLVGGLGFTDVKQSFVASGLLNGSGSDSTNEMGYYVGAQYDWDRIGLRLSYEKFDFDGDIDATETSLTFFYRL
jgi:opacity protein-like surface antigen